MALTTLGNTAFSTSAVVSATIKDSAVVYNKLDANVSKFDGIKWGSIINKM